MLVVWDTNTGNELLHLLRDVFVFCYVGSFWEISVDEMELLLQGSDREARF